MIKIFFGRLSRLGKYKESAPVLNEVNAFNIPVLEVLNLKLADPSKLSGALSQSGLCFCISKYGARL